MKLASRQVSWNWPIRIKHSIYYIVYIADGPVQWLQCLILSAIRIKWLLRSTEVVSWCCHSQHINCPIWNTVQAFLTTITFIMWLYFYTYLFNVIYVLKHIIHLWRVPPNRFPCSGYVLFSLLLPPCYNPASHLVNMSFLRPCGCVEAEKQ